MPGRGAPFDTAIYCNTESVSTYLVNFVKGFGIATQRCVDAGGNSILP